MVYVNQNWRTLVPDAPRLRGRDGGSSLGAPGQTGNRAVTGPAA